MSQFRLVRLITSGFPTALVYQADERLLQRRPRYATLDGRQMNLHSGDSCSGAAYERSRCVANSGRALFAQSIAEFIQTSQFDADCLCNINVGLRRSLEPTGALHCEVRGSERCPAPSAVWVTEPRNVVLQIGRAHV